MTRLTNRSEWLQDFNAMLISALCNMTALVAMGLLTAAAQDSWRGVSLLVSGNEGDSALLDELPMEDAFKLEAAADPAAAFGPIEVFDDSAVAMADFAALASPVESTAAAAAGRFDGAAPSGDGEGDDDAHQAATEFFGIGGYGQSFVYVVDASDSMNERGKFDRARYELLQSIEQLASDQRYYVIFYNDAAHPMNADEPVLATQDHVAKTVRWVNGAAADGGTNPLPALLVALSLRPDAIYFLSDGQFDPMTITHLRYRNRSNRRLKTRQIPIHTVAFMDYGTRGLMHAIARHSGGEFRFVQ